MWVLVMLVPAMTFAGFLYTLVWHHYMQGCVRIGMCMRSGVLMLIYRKALRLTGQELASSSNSEVNNLVTSDAERIAQGLTFSHFTWGSPVEILISTVLAYNEIGWPACGGVAILLLQMPVQSFFGGKTGALRKRVAAFTDERVRTMNEVLAGVQTIKLFGWEASFVRRVAAVRQGELAALWRMQAVYGVNRSLSFITTMLVTLASFGVYQALGEDLTVAKAFVCLAYFRQIELAITMLPLAVRGWLAGWLAGWQAP
eukprot:SAG22_NODE_669_length_7994_cov_2.526536_6_plen_257_part_00